MRPLVGTIGIRRQKKLNSDCNMTARLEAVLQVAVGAGVMLRRNIDTTTGLVNGAVGTVLSMQSLAQNLSIIDCVASL